MIQRRIWVSGRVQGVGFRAATVREAQKYLGQPGSQGLRGYVKNLPDGRVEVLLSGEERDVLALCAWCKQGPSTARVTAIEVKEERFEPALSSFHRE